MLRSLKFHPKPASLVSSPFVAVADPDLCQGCGMCLDRCQMEALSLDGGLVALDGDRCIGCGLCITTCPGGALHLRRKPEAEQSRVPKHMVETYLRLGRVRGKLGPRELVGMVVRSKVDRLLAPR